MSHKMIFKRKNLNLKFILFIFIKNMINDHIKKIDLNLLIQMKCISFFKELNSYCDFILEVSKLNRVFEQVCPYLACLINLFVDIFDLVAET